MTNLRVYSMETPTMSDSTAPADDAHPVEDALNTLASVSSAVDAEFAALDARHQTVKSMKDRLDSSKAALVQAVKDVNDVAAEWASFVARSAA